MEWNWGEQVDSKGEMLSSLEERKICNIQYSNLEKCVRINYARYFNVLGNKHWIGTICKNKYYEHQN